MEEELNYISDKIEEIEHQLNITSFSISLKMDKKDNFIKLENEKRLLENILNSITITELNK